MVLGQHKRAVGVFPNRHDAEYALNELRDSGFPMHKVSVIVRDADQHDDIAGADVRERVSNKADEGAVTGAVAGGALGGLTGLLVGLGLLAIPGIGPVMLAGATATTIATTLSGGALGAISGGIIGALIGLGIPEERARVYNERVAQGEYLVIVDGTDDEIARAEAILRSRGIQELGIYDVPNSDRYSTDYVTTATPNPGIPGVGLTRNKHAVGYFSHLRDAEQAIAALRDAGFPLSKISLVAQHFERRELFTGVELRDRFEAMRWGLPEERVRFYSDRVTRGDYVVIVSGTEDEIRQAASILSNYGIQEWQIYDPTAISYATTTTSHHEDAGIHVGRQHRAVGVFPNRQNAEAALTQLRDSGFPMTQVSVIAKDLDRHHHLAGAEVRDTPPYNDGASSDFVNVPHNSNVATHVDSKADEGAKVGAATGGAIGGLTGLLVGLGTLAIPGLGPIMLAGAGATALATTVAGGAIGAAAGGLGGALVGLGIPEERARIYNDRVARGDYLVMVDGTDDEIRRVQVILSHWGIQDWGIYDAPVIDTTPRSHASEHVVDQEAKVIIIDRRHETV